MPTETTTQPKTTRGRILERRCTCGRRVCDARLTGNSVVRLTCPRCGRTIEITAERYSAVQKPPAR